MYKHTNEQAKVKISSKKYLQKLYLEDAMLYLVPARYLLKVSCSVLHNAEPS